MRSSPRAWFASIAHSAFPGLRLKRRRQDSRRYRLPQRASTRRPTRRGRWLPDLLHHATLKWSGCPYDSSRLMGESFEVYPNCRVSEGPDLLCSQNKEGI
jgi:hypothetical protein